MNTLIKRAKSSALGKSITRASVRLNTGKDLFNCNRKNTKWASFLKGYRISGNRPASTLNALLASLERFCNTNVMSWGKFLMPYSNSEDHDRVHLCSRIMVLCCLPNFLQNLMNAQADQGADQTKRMCRLI